MNDAVCFIIQVISSTQDECLYSRLIPMNSCWQMSVQLTPSSRWCRRLVLSATVFSSIQLKVC